MISSALSGSKRGISVSVPAAGLPERVKQRQRTERHGLGSDPVHIARDLTVALQVRVGELGALGSAGGARRVQDHGGVVGGAVDDLAPRLDVRQELLELTGLD